MKKIYYELLLLLLLKILWISVAFCADTPLIPLEKFFDNPKVENCQISPDGRWMSCLKPYQGKLNVFIRNLQSRQERPITAERERPVLNYFWSADSGTILYLQDHLGDENYHLFAVPVEGKTLSTPLDLTPFQKVTVEVVSIPHGSREILIMMNQRNPELMDAYWLNIHKGTLRAAAQNPGNFIAYQADLANQVRAAAGISSNGETEIYTRASEKESWSLLKKYPVQEIVALLAFHQNGRQVYVKSSLGRDLAALCLLDLSTGLETVMDQDPQGESDLVDAFFDPKTRQLIATIYEGDKIRAYGATPEIKHDLQFIRSASGHNFYLGASSDDHRKWVITFYSPTNPGQIFLYERGKEKLQLMEESRPWLKADYLSTAEPVTFQSKDGLTIRGYLTLPRGMKNINLPMVLFVHGGPWERDRWNFDSVVQFLANRGYAVLQINYRGSTGFGKKFAYAAKKEFAGAMHQDLIDGVNWVVNKGIDPKRIAIIGLSYGGYATLVGLTFTPDTFACGVDYAGPSSLITLIESFPPSWKPFLGRRWFPMVGDPSRPEDREDMKKRSPLFYADRIKVPLLIYQGVNDPRVTQEQADRMVIALRNRGVHAEYLLAKDEGHGLDNPANALAVFHATEKFLSACLNGRVQEKVDASIENHLKQMIVDVNSLKISSETKPD
ncbi:S9 family peptidase [bacterium]|nr:S9 family peptidase [bacterium]